MGYRSLWNIAKGLTALSYTFHAHAALTAIIVGWKRVLRRIIAHDRAVKAMAKEQATMDAEESTGNVLFNAKMTTYQTIVFSTIGALCTLATKILEHVRMEWRAKVWE